MGTTLASYADHSDEGLPVGSVYESLDLLVNFVTGLTGAVCGLAHGLTQE